jgi:hypothetical protein
MSESNHVKIRNLAYEEQVVSLEDPDICLAAPVRLFRKRRAWGCAPGTEVYRFRAKTWQDDMAGVSAGGRPPAMFRQQDERSGCSSAEPYPLACQG